MNNIANTQPLYIVKTNSLTNLFVGQDSVQHALEVHRRMSYVVNEFSIDIYDSLSDPRKTMLLASEKIHNDHILGDSFNIYCSELVDPLSRNNKCIYIYVKKDLKEDDLSELYKIHDKNTIYGYIHGYANALKLKNDILKVLSNHANDISLTKKILSNFAEEPEESIKVLLDVPHIEYDKNVYNGLIPLIDYTDDISIMDYDLYKTYKYVIYTNEYNHKIFVPEKDIKEFKEWLESKTLIECRDEINSLEHNFCTTYGNNKYDNALKKDNMSTLYLLSGEFFGYVHGYDNAIKVRNIVASILNISKDLINVTEFKCEESVNIYKESLKVSENGLIEGHTLHTLMKKHNYSIYTTDSMRPIIIPSEDVECFDKWLMSDSKSDRGATPSFAIMDETKNNLLTKNIRDRATYVERGLTSITYTQVFTGYVIAEYHDDNDDNSHVTRILVKEDAFSWNKEPSSEECYIVIQDHYVNGNLSSRKAAELDARDVPMLVGYFSLKKAYQAGIKLNANEDVFDKSNKEKELAELRKTIHDIERWLIDSDIEFVIDDLIS